MINVLYIIFILFIVPCIVVSSLLLTGVISFPMSKDKVLTPKNDIKSGNLQSIKSSSTKKLPSINPQPFKTGYIENTPQPLADVCNSKIYPVEPVYVNYNLNESDLKCDVNVFNSPP